MIVFFGLVIVLLFNIVFAAWTHARYDASIADDHTGMMVCSSLIVVMASALMGMLNAILLIIMAIVITALIRGTLIGSIFLYDYFYKKFTT